MPSQEPKECGNCASTGIVRYGVHPLHPLKTIISKPCPVCRDDAYCNKCIGFEKCPLPKDDGHAHFGGLYCHGDCAKAEPDPAKAAIWEAGYDAAYFNKGHYNPYE